MMHSKSKVTFRYKKDRITEEHHRARKSASDFQFEVNKISTKFSIFN